MKIGVLIKQVPVRDAELTIAADESWIDETGVTFESCEPDDYALEAALQLKEAQGGEVVAISLGPARVQEVLSTALAKGADRAIHIVVERTGPASGCRRTGSHRDRRVFRSRSRWPAIG